MAQNKLSGMGLKSFSGFSNQDTPKEEARAQSSIHKTDKQPGKNKTQVSNINIKIPKDQKVWLTDKASRVRENNIHPVPANERVFPQHLVCVAIDLLRATDIDWSEIKSEQDLRKHLNL